MPVSLPRPYQARALLGLLDAWASYPGETLTVMFPRQAGKNEVAAMFLGALLLMHAERGGTAVVCAPTARPQVRISYDRLVAYFAGIAPLVPQAARPRPEGEHVIRVGKASAVFLSASPAAHVAGHTASIALIADEAQEIDAPWFERQFRPMAASTAAPTVMFGTAWDGRSMLEKAADRNRKLDAANPGAAPRHCQVSWHEVERSVPGYGRYVRQERTRLGPSSPFFLSQYELVAAEMAGRLLDPATIDALEGPYPRLTAAAPGERYVAGLDLGGDRPGADRSVLTVARLAGDRVEVVDQRSWRSADYPRIEGEVLALARAWRFERLVVDATGLGGPISARLERELGHRLERFVFTASSKSDLGYALVSAANTGRLALYASDGSSEAEALRLELRLCQSTTRAGGRLEWGIPAGSDDHAISLALCVRAAQQVGPARVAVGRRRE